VPRTPRPGVARLVEHPEDPGDAQHVVVVGVLQRHLGQLGDALQRRQHLAQQPEPGAVEVDAHERRRQQVAVDELGRPVGVQAVVGRIGVAVARVEVVEQHVVGVLDLERAGAQRQGVHADQPATAASRRAAPARQSCLPTGATTGDDGPAPARRGSSVAGVAGGHGARAAVGGGCAGAAGPGRDVVGRRRPRLAARPRPGVRRAGGVVPWRQAALWRYDHPRLENRLSAASGPRWPGRTRPCWRRTRRCAGTTASSSAAWA
jgi:hypothetical protein